MLMWADADAASGDESDFQAWVDFDEQVKAAGAFVLNGALTPAATDARLVQTTIAGHALDEAVERRPFAGGERQIQAFYNHGASRHEQGSRVGEQAAHLRLR